ncbi:Methyltransferase domain-containing protein [Pseudodesulfovibrio profundus]|uniref:Methyltransferase domain-containing protein n=1 Tax=Pseudodesulfovibrio profundus TaxID=57320 RepID=A0A2C8FAI3_9BACT|nr:class I SAM-dependent methyltransferase [Pseudodesulfovibrio profundus]SOB59510.1 Methyltransferase domain-containing protein [Pseudodesulfovibrio profundus]
MPDKSIPHQPAKITPGKPTLTNHVKIHNCKMCGTPSPILWLREEHEPLPVYDFFGPDYARPYYQCPKCNFIFCTDFDALCAEELDWIYDGMATQSLLKGRINRGYRETVMVINYAALQHVDVKRAKILVFGCGTGLSMNLMLQHEMRPWATDYAEFDFTNTDYPADMYNPALAPVMRKRFIPLDALPKEEFDIITMTEVFEHFTRPRKEMTAVMSALRPGGFLIGTTGVIDWRENPDFSAWWYKDAQTHVSFLSERSFRQMAKDFGCLGMLYKSSPILIGQTDMSASQCVFVLKKVP